MYERQTGRIVSRGGAGLCCMLLHDSLDDRGGV